jgi:hypothetical protein
MLNRPKPRRMKNKLAFPLLEDQDSNTINPFGDDSGIGLLPDHESNTTAQGARPIIINEEPAPRSNIPDAEHQSLTATPSSSLRPILISSGSYSMPTIDTLPSHIPVGSVDVYDAEYRAYSIANSPHHTDFDEIVYSGKGR